MKPMTRKEKAAAYRKLAADRAKLAARYAKGESYDEAARWYTAADIFMRMALEFSETIELPRTKGRKSD